MAEVKAKTEGPMVTKEVPLDLAKAEETGDPIGTYEALRKFKLNPRRYGSCSAPIDGQNKGCPAYHHCRFPEYRDHREYKGQRMSGPGNVGVLMITPNNAAANHIKSCFQYYQAGDDGKRRNSDKNGWVVQIVGLEGDTVLDRGSRRQHRKRDPDCPSCQEGKCHKMIATEQPRLIGKFPRLGEHESSESASFAMRMREDMLKSVDSEKQAIALTSHNTEIDRITRPADPETELKGDDVPGRRE